MKKTGGKKGEGEGKKTGGEEGEGEGKKAGKKAGRRRGRRRREEEEGSGQKKCVIHKMYQLMILYSQTIKGRQQQ